MAVEVVKGGGEAARPDSDFAAVWTDAQGRKQRKLPIYDKAHAMNARARFNQTDMPSGMKAKVLKRIEAAERKFNVEAAKDRSKGDE